MKRIFLCLFAALLSLASAHAERVALVIGNNKYKELPERMQLTSPVADAKDVAAALKSLGYTLVTGAAVTDASRESLTAATEKFATLAKSAEAAVFYYSGHGIQVGDDNYLLPTDTPKLTGISMLKNRGVLLRDSVMVALEEAGAKTKVIILDCCRDNPFSAQLEQAMSQVGKSIKTKSVGEITGYGPGFYLAFATSPGQTAADGNGARNSPFTAAMLKAFPESAVKDIDFFFRDVKSLLPDDQVSWTNHSIKGAFSFGSSLPAPAQNVPVVSLLKPRTINFEKQTFNQPMRMKPTDEPYADKTWKIGPGKLEISENGMILTYTHDETSLARKGHAFTEGEKKIYGVHECRLTLDSKHLNQQLAAEKDAYQCSQEGLKTASALGLTKIRKTGWLFLVFSNYKSERKNGNNQLFVAQGLGDLLSENSFYGIIGRINGGGLLVNAELNQVFAFGGGMMQWTKTIPLQDSNR